MFPDDSGIQEQQAGYPYSTSNPKRVDLSKVDSYTPADYGLTVNAVKALMFGMKVVDPDTGKEMPDSAYLAFISNAITKAEQDLDVVILPRVLGRERHDFYENDYGVYGYVKSNYRPILQVEDLSVMFNNQRIMRMPKDYWKVYSRTGEVESFPTGFLTAIGSQGGAYGVSSVNQTVPQWLAFPTMYGLDNYGWNYSPQAIQIDYVAGMLPPQRMGVTRDFEMPMTLNQLILKIALKDVLQIWGDLIIGAGISSKELAIDDIHENIVSTQSASFTGAGARIQLLDSDISNLEDGLKSYYGQSITEV